MTSLDGADELERRTKQFAVRIVDLFRPLPRPPDAQASEKAVAEIGYSGRELSCNPPEPFEGRFRLSYPTRYEG